MKTAAAILGILVIGFISYCGWYMVSNGTPIDVIVSPRKTPACRVSLPILTEGEFSVAIYRTDREMPARWPEVRASIDPPSRGEIWDTHYDDPDPSESPVVTQDASVPASGEPWRCDLFELRVKGKGSGVIVFEFQDPQSWPEQVRIMAYGPSL